LDSLGAVERSLRRARGRDKRFKELENILISTKALQTKFFFDRVVDAIPEIVKYLPKERQERVKSNYNAVADSHGGWYPLIDYINFKGKGIKETEKYNGEGWGLLQVLENMRPVSKRSRGTSGVCKIGKFYLRGELK